MLDEISFDITVHIYIVLLRSHSYKVFYVFRVRPERIVLEPLKIFSLFQKREYMKMENVGNVMAYAFSNLETFKSSLYYLQLVSV